MTTPQLPTTITPIARTMMSALFLISGIGKVMAPAATIAFIGSSGLPLAPLAFAIAVGVEVGGGTLLAMGINTRVVAIGLALFSVVTGLAFHHQVGDPMQLTELLKNIAIAGGLLQLAASDAGASGSR